MFNLQSKLVTTAAVVATAVSGVAIANAATTKSTTTPAPASKSQADNGTRPTGPHTVNGRSEKPLTGDTESKVRAAALAKVPGTVERVETNVDSSAPYEAHITKSDGSEVEVQVASDFTVAAVNAMGDHHP